MDRTGVGLSVLLLIAIVPNVGAQSLWERRDPQTAYLFSDTRARNVGDLLTIVVNESTAVDNSDSKALNKQTLTSGSVAANGNVTAGSVGNMIRKYAGEVDAAVNSQRKFDGSAATSIDRKLVDRMTVVVVNVLPNGLLVVEGRRSRLITKEERTLVVTGIVRPLDIGPGNVIQSQFVADFTVCYEGRGPESNYTDHGWLSNIVSKLWPF